MLAAAALTLLAACGGSSTPSPATTSGAPHAGGTLDLAFWPDNAAFNCVDPFQTYWIEHRTVIRNFADSLTDQDPATGKIVPWLATSWKVAGSGKSYTFTLRDGVTFSDGTKLDATAVKTSFDGDAALLKDLPTAYGGVYIAGYAGTDVIDDHTVRVRFSEPNAAFLQATSTTNLAILAPSSYAKTPEQLESTLALVARRQNLGVDGAAALGRLVAAGMRVVRAHAVAPLRMRAMWMNFSGTPTRSAQPFWCMRQEESAETTYSAPAWA